MPRPNVRLLTPDLALLDAALAGDSAFAEALGCEVTEGWNGFPQALRATRASLAADPANARWGTRLFLVGDPPTLVGWGGFKGPPLSGTVELGYEIAPSFRGRGLATAAAHELLREALAAPEVESVLAHTLAEPGPSVRVLEKLGFAYEDERGDEDDGSTWRFSYLRSRN